MGYQNIRCYLRDGFNGLPEFAPFEKIIATAGATEIPKALMKQLKIGGILVIPVGRNVQHMLRIIRKSELEYIQEDHGEFRFVPFLKGIQ
jgi:protein-L-isoaspartate(D-aspartate) O-methyltransferase